MSIVEESEYEHITSPESGRDEESIEQDTATVERVSHKEDSEYLQDSLERIVEGFSEGKSEECLDTKNEENYSANGKNNCDSRTDRDLLLDKVECSPEKCKRKAREEKEEWTDGGIKEHLCKKMCPLVANQVCERCGGKGHSSIHCTSSEQLVSTHHSQYVDTSRKEHSLASGKHETRICYHCGNQGHLIKECPYIFVSSPRVFVPSYEGWQVGPSWVGTVPVMPVHVPLYPLTSSPQRARGSRIRWEGWNRSPTMHLDSWATLNNHSALTEHQLGAVGASSYAMKNKVNHGRCFRCGKYGHWTRDCPEKPVDAAPDGCYKCGQRGHLARECTACYICLSSEHKAIHCPKNPRAR
ncbi:zinc knuckle (CCHC-type) family protein [Galdieria sulphuraria]|uniref:Zinc knuckle (CCHC-type) family protein n=1 Tax=Galdieria sulphuraria TaxID=130081 RepID=M2WXU1_GALSU|nr:zinc knuckle (CCHC-type) family protein [Galdieria sulphuraria]EME28860.1 zinc knuckle (CCHC-type) family protein [Galdieria sulphuraria]|eukprot:XP_005705380.1 zinc knuckle (CCHC-type) family protein [Galdieria sulphuraria]